MAIQRILLGAHDRDAFMLNALRQSIDSGLEEVRLGEPVVTDATAVVAARIRRARSKFVAKEDVLDASLPERLSKGILAELRRKAAVRG